MNIQTLKNTCEGHWRILNIISNLKQRVYAKTITNLCFKGCLRTNLFFFGVVEGEDLSSLDLNLLIGVFKGVEDLFKFKLGFKGEGVEGSFDFLNLLGVVDDDNIEVMIFEWNENLRTCI